MFGACHSRTNPDSKTMQRLYSISQAMPELGLESLVARTRAIPHRVELAGEIGVRRNIDILAHQLAACGANVGDRDHSGVTEPSFHRRVPLIGSGQYVIGVDDGKIPGRRCS